MMSSILGEGNTWLSYLPVLLVYLLLFVVMRYATSRVELNFRVSYRLMALGWSISVFIGNYLFYRLGIMSFLPWLNNALHTFVWIGLCLSFLYAGCYRRPIWEQCLLFSIFSVIVKFAERQLLGTWELDHFFFIDGNLAYILGWSLMDGLYPFISMFALTQFSRFVRGVVVPGRE